MVAEGDLRVTASRHATDRAMTRRGEFKKRGHAISWVEETAFEAISAGRKAKRLPRWCQAGDYRARLNGEGVYRFVWDEAQSAVFLVRKIRDDTDLLPLWLVLTVVVPRASG